MGFFNQSETQWGKRVENVSYLRLAEILARDLLTNQRHKNARVGQVSSSDWLRKWHEISQPINDAGL